MATYSTSLKLTLIGDGEQTGTWGSTTNTNFGTLLEQAIVGQTTIIMANADYTLTNLNGTLDEARSAVIIVTGTQNATYSVIVPAVPKLYMVTNSLTAPQVAYIKMSGGTTTQVPNGQTMYLYCTGVIGASWGVLNYVQNAQNLVTGGTITTGAINCTSLLSTGTITGTTITGTLFSGPGTSITGTAGSLNIGGNAATATTVSTTVASGATGTTQTAGDNSTKIATTAYVATAVNNATSTLGTMATQNANAVAITGGTINGVSGTNASLTVGNATNATNATTAVTVSTTVASGAVGTTQASSDSSTKIATTAFVQAVVQALYPIGSIYSSTSATNPQATFGFGTWIAYAAGRVLVGAGGAFSGTGGSADAVIVSHDHNGNTGNNNVDHIHGVYGNTGEMSNDHTHVSGVASDTSAFGTAAIGTTDGKGGTIPYGTSPITSGVSANHTHSVSIQSAGQSATHIHGFLTGNANGGVSGTNANMQPYVVVYMWTRTA
jgi:hypothetical protein